MHTPTNSMSPSKQQIVTLLVLGLALLGYREWMITQLPSALFYDEIYYYGWSLTPDWGYYSKPPVVAWVIGITTSLFGDSALAIKVGSGLLYLAATVMLYLSMLRLSDAKSAFYAALLFISMPLVSFNSLFITTDAPLIFFWTLSFYGFVRAKESNLWQWWLLAAVAGGLGLLSKYTFILFPVTFLLFALVSESGRKLLLNSRFWVACLLALSFLLPNLYWNYQHDFISFQHTASISKQEENNASVGRLLEFWAQQLIVFSPLLFILVIASVFRRSIPSTQTQKLLWCLFLPTFVVISAQAFLARANMNWAAPAYVAGAMLAGIYLRYWARPWIILTLIINAVFMVGFYHFGAITQQLDVSLDRGNDPYRRLKGWPELVEQLQPVFEQYPDHSLASNSRSMLSYVGYYLEPKQMNASYLDDTDFIDDHYELKYPVQPNQAYLFVTNTWNQQQLLRFFSSVEQVSTASFTVYEGVERSAVIYAVSGYKGK